MPRGDLCKLPSTGAAPPFAVPTPGYQPDMSLPLLLIVIGIVLAILVHYAIGIVCILVGLVLLVWPRLTTSRV